MMNNSFFNAHLDEAYICQRLKELEKAKVGFYSIGLYPASLAYNCAMQTDGSRLLLAPREGRDLLGAFSIDASYGFEGVYNDKVMIRAGRNSVNNLTGGIGLAWDGLRVDYAFLSTHDNGGLDIHHLISLSVSLEMFIHKMLDTNKS